MHDAELAEELKSRQDEALQELEEISIQLKDLINKRNSVMDRCITLNCSLSAIGRASHVSRQAIWNRVNRNQ